MRELLTDDGYRGAEARQDGHGEGGSNGQPVDEVMQGVAQRYHPRYRLHGGQLLTHMPQT